MNRFAQVSLLVLTAFIAAACGDGEAPGTEGAGTGEPSAQDPMGGMGPMGMPGDGMMGDMTAHLRRMEALGADSTQAVLGEHRQRVANMLAQMEREMGGMGMNPDLRWDALADSVRTDLEGMLGMGPDQLQGMMPTHRARITRMMEMHGTMTGSGTGMMDSVGM